MRKFNRKRKVRKNKQRYVVDTRKQWSLSSRESIQSNQGTLRNREETLK